MFLLMLLIAPTGASFRNAEVTACLISSEREPEDLLYDVFLPYLIKAPAVVDALYPKDGV